MALFKAKEKENIAPDMTHLPRHIAIIMDGNGRWAKKRGLPRTAGHAAGAETFRTIATYCKEIGLDYLTVYAFSTENWKRPEAEVNAIMGLLKKYLMEAIGQMERDRVKMEFFGDTSVLTPELQELIARTREISRHYEGCQVNICLNYGGRDEILRAARSFAQECAEGKAKSEDLTEDRLSNGLFSAGVPDPDLQIRKAFFPTDVSTFFINTFVLTNQDRSKTINIIRKPLFKMSFSESPLHRSHQIHQSHTSCAGNFKANKPK